MSRMLDHKPDTILELITNSAPGIWQSPTVPKKCCIYRVPHRLRRVNPEAYTPQLVLIGPLHHSLKSQAIRTIGDITKDPITKTKLMGYLNMEKHKRFYLTEFAQRFDGQKTIDEFKRIIEENEEDIRASYSESTSWIKSPEFVEMILLDSVFILEFIVRSFLETEEEDRILGTEEGDRILGTEDGDRILGTEDRIMDNLPLRHTIYVDLTLLENQLPFFIFEKLFNQVAERLLGLYPVLAAGLGFTISFRNLISIFFEVKCIGQTSHGNVYMIRHFTDLRRWACVETLPKKPKTTRFQGHRATKKTSGSRESKNMQYIEHVYNAEKLYSAGMEFVTVKNEVSIDVSFEKGCLTLPEMWIIEETEIIIRNIMALEQCHYTSETYVCDYVTFLDFLIDSDKDVDLLIEKGILNNWIGEQKAVATMVNKLRLGIVDCDDSYYSDVAADVNAYYENPWNRTRVILSRMYFSNVWRGTATVAAILLLVMTFLQTVGSGLQYNQK